MSITGNLNVFPFSLTGLQNFDGTINGSTPINDITIAGQTTFLSATAVDVNGDVVLDLHIPDGTSLIKGINYDLIQTLNTWTNTNQFNSNFILNTAQIYLTAISPTTAGYLLAFNPISQLVTYNLKPETANNIFTGTQDFSNTTMKMSLNSADTGFHVGYDPTTRAVTFNSDASSNLLGSNNIFTGTNEFSNVNIRFSGLTTSSDSSSLRINLTTGQISTSLISSLSILGLANTFTSTNTFNDVVKMGSYIDLNDNFIYLKTNDGNHYLTYDGVNVDGWVLAGNVGGCWGSTSTSSFNKMHVYDNSNNIYYESNGDLMAYLVRNGITDLKWVIFRTPTSYAFYNTLSNTLGTTSDERTKKDIKGIDINKSKQFILSITPSTFRFRDGNTSVKNIGFIAQDILKNATTEAQKNIISNWKIYEDALEKGEEAYEEYTDGLGKKKYRKVMLGVSAMSIVPELVGTIQSQNREIISLNERLLRIEKLLDLK